MQEHGVERFVREELTEPQAEAALDEAHEILSLACAGSGKSRTLGYRIAHLVSRGVDAAGIVAFTFTVKAAEALKLRVATALGNTGQDPLVLGKMFIGTIDAFTKTQLGNIDARYRQFEQLDPPRMVLYLMSRYGRLGIQRLRIGRRYFETVEGVSEAWETMQNEGITLDQIEQRDRTLGAVLQSLQRQLDIDGYIDFASTARKVAEAYEGEVHVATGRLLHVEHLLVDEYQDVNPLQQRLVDAIRANGATLFAVGDDDQAIFGFRGADVTNILTFSDRYPGANIHELVENFRSTAAIVNAASAFVQAELGANRMPKHPVAHADIQPQDIAVLQFADRNAEAAWVAGRIRQLLGTAYDDKGTVRGLTPADFAILMKSTRRGDWGAVEANHRPYTESLHALGIDAVVESTGDLFDRPYAAMVREAFELLRVGSPNRDVARAFLINRVRPLFPLADETRFFNVVTDWGRKIHTPVQAGAPRQRLYPQQLMQELLESFSFAETQLQPQAYHDLGTTSRILQDVEAVYATIDGADRWGSILNFLSNAADGKYEPGSDDVLARPDAVFVSTIHKAKGLEFPVVFIVDCRSSQYPGRNTGYSGMLPSDLMAAATRRGAYVNRPDNSARVFYTAMTRAERHLYITVAHDVGGKRPAALSRYGAQVIAAGANQDPALVTPPGRPAQPKRRLDQETLPTTFTDVRYYLRCPHDYKLRKVYGFSPPINEMFGFGQTVHTSIGKIHELHPGGPPKTDDAERIARETFQLKHVLPSRDPETRPGAYERARDAAATIARHYVEQYPDDFAERRQVEVRFEIPLRGSVITGAIDLLVKRDAGGDLVHADIVDFKAIQGERPPGSDPLDNQRLDWTELTLQVQLYAVAANEVLGENAKTGSVHLLKDNLRIHVPIDDDALAAAIANLEWAVERIIDGDFPMRPADDKCNGCDYKLLCPKRWQEFTSAQPPPELHLPDGRRSLPAAFDR